MPAPAELVYRLDDSPTEHKWSCSYFPCPPYQIALRIAEHAAETSGSAPAVVWLRFIEDENFKRIDISDAKAQDEAMWAKD